jgi:quinohemoprotein ethanol dehydrogenase
VTNVRKAGGVAAAATLGAVLLWDAGLQASGPAPVRERPAAAVDAARLKSAASDTANWMSYGRTYDEQRFSPLTQVNSGNAGALSLAWYADFDTDRGQEATPLVIDGVLYVSTAWSMVKAYDAQTGKLLWSYDPQVPREWGVNACCDVVNRGVAVWRGKVFVGTLDGRLVAIDAATGRKAWETLTIDKTKPYTITGAPRVVKGKVLIGNGGSEYGVRGYVSAYDAETGKMAWRFYTVPGDPAKPYESLALAAAAKTWFGDQYWKLGGGGTVWDAMAYDPELDLLYIGVGNGSPWNRKVRSAGKGDNLFLSSVVAIRPETGEYVWHYQTTPGDEWDYTATQHIMLADLTIDGKPRRVLMQAPKNGFFYVLDRATGKLISAKPFIPLNWATGVDPATGRPIENPDARYSETGKPWMAMPSAIGGHSWYPMAFSPKTGLVYVPAQEVGGGYDPQLPFVHSRKGWNLGVKFGETPFPTDPKVVAGLRASLKGYVLAWDPVHQREVFRIPHKGPFNGGMLATAGNLLFQGDAGGHLNAYRADSGAQLWRFDAQSAITAAPITYSVGGVQYVAVAAGKGGIMGVGPGQISDISGKTRNLSRILVFRIGGKAVLPRLTAAPALPPIVPLPDRGSPAQIEAGRLTFGRYCSVCHGSDAVSAGVIPDLRHSGALGQEAFNAVVRDGALKDNGMVSFADVLSPERIEAVRLYVVDRARLTAATETLRPSPR